MSKTLSGPGSALTQVWIRQQTCVLSLCECVYIYMLHIHMYVHICMDVCVRGDIGQLPNHPIFGAF